MELNWIQRHILLVLIRKSSARLKELQVPDMPANQFVYHLDGLITHKIVVKISRGVYALTPRGQKIAGTFSTSLGEQVEYIKTVVLLYGKLGDRYLLYRWSRQPYLGYATPPHKQVPRGVSLQNGIKSALDEKLDSRQPITYRTSSLITILHNDEIVSHLNALIYEVSVEELDLPRAMRNGQAFLSTLNETDKLMDGVGEFFKKLEKVTSPFDSEWRY